MFIIGLSTISIIGYLTDRWLKYIYMFMLWESQTHIVLFVIGYYTFQVSVKEMAIGFWLFCIASVTSP